VRLSRWSFLAVVGVVWLLLLGTAVDGLLVLLFIAHTAVALGLASLWLALLLCVSFIAWRLYRWTPQNVITPLAPSPTSR
jgi:hypothetical protein